VAHRRLHRDGGRPAHSCELGEPTGSGHRSDLRSRDTRGNPRDHGEGDAEQPAVAPAPCVKAPGSSRPGRYLFYFFNTHEAC